MQIMWGACHPFIEDSFLRQILKVSILMRDRHHKALVDIGVQEFKVISAILTQCQEMKNEEFRLIGSGCDSFQKVERIENLRTGKTFPYRPLAQSFVWGKYDPLPEAAWSAVAFVNSYCSPFFVSNFPHFHMYVIAMEALFPPYPVQRQWTTPTNISTAIFNSVLETADVKIAMRNLDACVLGGNRNTIFRHRIERPFTPEVLLATPTYSTPPETDMAGWTKSLAAYWRQYEARGGFRGVSKDWGYCLQDPQEPEAKQSTVDDIRTKTCGGAEPSDGNQQ
ncbi:uncharacterized protein LOC110858534 [Folsomia candida]|uniref:uncharacterized protein LOC110858534 n=1 Tax=Folsomia candida TaxID=158441 RepID=UPI001604CD83|nr:uncharacterized protein LOC110858534 [Folsomia candida]